MARLRYVKDTALAAAPTPAKGGAKKLSHTVRSIRVIYETDPEIAAALLPRPLVAADAPEIFVQFASVAMHLAEDRTLKIGAATVGVSCTHEGLHGYYVLAMPMEGEFVVIGGRERYGEPKKIATTEFTEDGDRICAKVTRHDVTFLELRGKLGGQSDSPKQFTEHFFCFKALPAAAAGTGGEGFDGDVMLTQLDWEREYTSVRHIEDGEVILRESPFDPLVDVPVRRIVKMEFAEGSSKTRGEVVRSVPGEWLAPFMVQRYDVPQEGIEVPLAREKQRAHG